MYRVGPNCGPTLVLYLNRDCQSSCWANPVLFWLGAGAYLNERLAEDAKARLKKGVIRYAVFVVS
jgi:hypothetical protein